MLWILVTFDTCQRDIKCWMSERVGSIKFCFVIDEQKKKIDSYVIILVGQVLEFFQCQIVHIWHVIHQTELVVTN